MSARATPARESHRRRLVAGAVALVVGTTCLFAMVLLDTGSGPLAVGLAIGALACLVTGTLSLGTTEPGQVM